MVIIKTVKMDDNDDFEFVAIENDKSGFDELVDDDGLLGDSDELGVISDLNREKKQVEELKKHLKSQCIESSKLIKKLKEQTTTNNQLQSSLKQEIKQLNDLKVSLNKEKQEFTQKKTRIITIITINVISSTTN